MPQSGRRHAAGVTAEELDSKRSFAPKRARAGACLAALALIWAAAPAALRAQGLSPSQTSSPAQSQARASAQRARPAAGCGLPLVATGRVKGVIDGRTLMLDDGREARLAAIEVAPVIAAAADGDERDRAGRAAQKALAELALGRDVALRQAAESTDRYGRIVAFGFVAQDNSVAQDNAERSLQHELVAQGHARLAARIESQACLGELRARERDARRAALGLWADPHYSVQSAEKPADITARRGRF
ncbi:MAG: thermonuclease family protein, partial [Rhodoplanes sp.]